MKALGLTVLPYDTPFLQSIISSPAHLDQPAIDWPRSITLPYLALQRLEHSVT